MTRLAVTERRTFVCPRCHARIGECVAPFTTAPTCDCGGRYPHKPQVMTTEDSPS